MPVSHDEKSWTFAVRWTTLGGSGGMLPQENFKMCMLSDAVWYILDFKLSK